MLHRGIGVIVLAPQEEQSPLQEEEETKQEATLARATATINTQAKIFALAQGKNLDAAKVQELANAF